MRSIKQQSEPSREYSGVLQDLRPEKRNLLQKKVYSQTLE